MCEKGSPDAQREVWAKLDGCLPHELGRRAQRVQKKHLLEWAQWGEPRNRGARQLLQDV